MSEYRRGNRQRHGRWFAAALGVLAAAVFVAPSGAMAGTPPGPPQSSAPNLFDTNIPYVAWRGEQVRAVKCDSVEAEPNGAPRRSLKELFDGDGNLKNGYHADILVESWSGPGRDPQLEAGTVKFFQSQKLPPTQRDCVRFDMVSSDPGLARVKLVVSDGNAEPILKHQFLFVWLSLGNVSIKEATNNDPSVPAGSNAAVADPSGDGVFQAGYKLQNGQDNKGRVQVKLTGTFPHPLAPGGTFTLPQDWPTIAGALATDNNPYSDNSLLWDIHDDQGLGANHVSGYCAPPFTALDDVDNCQGGGDLGPFSNQFGQGVSAGGPFDPARPGTLLSNGRLTADDAPMPAARIDVGINPNSGSPTDISGVGSLGKADKTEVYSRNGNGTSDAHNLYAPYYVQWIPATSEGSAEASGIDGPQRGNNFEGFFLNGAYDNWSTFPLVKAYDGPTNCNKFVSFKKTLGIDDGPYHRPDEDMKPGGDIPRIKPYGDQVVAVYTDEHGEAQVEYKPGTGFYFDNLPTLRNDNRGCDLQDVTTLGTSDISATAKYPYQPVDDSSRTSTSIRKTVINKFDKSLSYYPKGPGEANNNARVVVAHANDVDGRPFQHELVCWMVDNNAEGVLPFSGETGPAAGRFSVESDPELLTGLLLKVASCARTDANGNVAIEVFNSNGTKVNVIALFADEGLLRDIKVDFGVAGSTGGTPPPIWTNGKQAVAPATGAGTTAPTAQELVSVAGPSAAAALKAPKAKKSRIAVARTVLKKGKRTVWVRVNSSRTSVRIVLRVGKRKLVRRVSTNRLVKVANVSVPKGVSVSVRLAR